MHPHRLRRRVFVHGAGRRGTDAWPTADPSSGTFVSFPADMTIPEQTDQITTMLSDGPTTLFAHSIGAVPAVLAVSAAPAADTALVLVEPALYDIARSEPAIEQHIAAVSEARSQAADANVRGSWGILRPLMFGGPIDNDLWDDERPLAIRWSTTNVPWGHGVRPAMLDSIRALVVTGGWNDEYEHIAAVLSARGAEHVVLPGAAHRAQDLAGFDEVVGEFESRLT